MKKILILFILLSAFQSQSQSIWLNELLAHREERNAEMKDTSHTPLKKAELLKFTELHFFEPDSSFRIVAQFTRLKKKEYFIMKTSGQKKPEYFKYAYVTFSIAGKSFKLFIYRNVELIKRKEYKNDMFLPFTDLTNANETYGGGRYLDLLVPKGNTIVIDFNRCYNPYCAYTTGYSCPVPPPENFVDFRIAAGEKLLWTDH